MGGTSRPDEAFRSAPEAVLYSASPRRRKTVKLPIVIHTEEDYDRAQQRAEELSAMPDTADKERELHALAEAMLAFELRRDEADD